MAEDAGHAAQQGPRTWLWVTVAFVFVVVSAVAAAITRGSTGWALTVWIVVQIGATGLAWLIPQLRQLLAEARQASAEEREFEARVETFVAMNDALDPIVRLLGNIALEQRKVERDQMRAQAVPLVPTTAAQLIGPDRARACWFRLEVGPPEEAHPGRGRRPGGSSVDHLHRGHLSR